MKIGLFLSIFCSLVFSDVYLPNIGRVFDFIGIIILGYLLALFRPRIKSAVVVGYFSSILFTLTIYYLYGGEFRHLLGILLSITYGFMLVAIVIEGGLECEFFRYINIALVFICVMFWIDFLLFHILESQFDPLRWLGFVPERNYIESINFFRASGVFQEPNALAVNIVICIFIIFSKGKLVSLGDSYIIMLSLWTLLASNSLWAFVGFLCCFIWFYFSGAPRRIIIISLVIPLFTYPLWLEEATINRILHISDESSLQERFIGARQVQPLVDKQRTVGEGDRSIFFGRGLYSVGFQFAYGANAISYLIFNLGILWTAFLGIASFFVFFDRITSRRFLLFGSMVGLIFTSFPLFTYCVCGMLFGGFYLTKSVGRDNG